MKSHVSLGQNICPICGKTHDTGSLLLNKRLEQTLEQRTVTGFGLCEPCKKLEDDGYIALIGIDPLKSQTPYGPSTVYRTGSVAHLRKTAWDCVFDVSCPTTPFAYCPQEVIELLQKATA
jgi:hypothetical protein